MMMNEARAQYRTLPGRRQGFLFGSSVWLGTDHLLLVKSARFREDYKRFYFRDIQAIVMADAPRFHISTRSAVIGCIWFCLLAIGMASARIPPAVRDAWGAMGLLLAGVWVGVSAKYSCRCRIYTAVSAEELPSVYRTWTARRFVNIVQPHITQVQGSIESNWAEAVEDKRVGPIPEGRIGFSMPGTSAPMPHRAEAAGTTLISNVFVGSLCAGGLAELLTVRARAPVGRWVLLSFLLLQLGAAVGVLIQSYGGKLRSAMRNLAIAGLVATGVWYYAAQFGITMAVAYQNAQSKNPKMYVGQQAIGLMEHPLARGSAGAVALLLGLAGVIVSLRGERQREEKVSFNV